MVIKSYYKILWGFLKMVILRVLIFSIIWLIPTLNFSSMPELAHKMKSAVLCSARADALKRSNIGINLPGKTTIACFGDITHLSISALQNAIKSRKEKLSIEDTLHNLAYDLLLGVRKSDGFAQDIRNPNQTNLRAADEIRYRQRKRGFTRERESKVRELKILSAHIIEQNATIQEKRRKELMKNLQEIDKTIAGLKHDFMAVSETTLTKLRPQISIKLDKSHKLNQKNSESELYKRRMGRMVARRAENNRSKIARFNDKKNECLYEKQESNRANFEYLVQQRNEIRKQLATIPDKDLIAQELENLHNLFDKIQKELRSLYVIEASILYKDRTKIMSPEYNQLLIKKNFLENKSDFWLKLANLPIGNTCTIDDALPNPKKLTEKEYLAHIYTQINDIDKELLELILEEVEFGYTQDYSSIEWWQVGECNQAKDCGAVMRVLPYALAFADDINKAECLAVKQSLLTHGSASSQAACAAMAVGIVQALHHQDPLAIAYEMMATAKKYDTQTAYLIERCIYEAQENNKEIFFNKLFSKSQEAFADLNTDLATHSLAAALYIFLVCSQDIHDAFNLALNSPQLNAVTASLACALMGAYNGMKDIPNSWIYEIERGLDLQNLATQAYELIDIRKFNSMPKLLLAQVPIKRHITQPISQTTNQGTKKDKSSLESAHAPQTITAHGYKPAVVESPVQNAQKPISFKEKIIKKVTRFFLQNPWIKKNIYEIGTAFTGLLIFGGLVKKALK